MVITINDMQIIRGAHGISLLVPLPLSEAETALELKKKLDEGKSLQLEIKALRKARTLSANAYAWSLCDEIAQALSKNGVYHSKEDVYRQAIRECGVFEIFGFASEEAMKAFADMWKRNGIGWVTEEMGDNELIVYFGSSVYDRQQMGHLIDCLIEEAKLQGVKIKASAEIENMLEAWEERRKKHEQR